MELVTSVDFNVSEGVGFSVGDTVDTSAINPDIEESLAKNNIRVERILLQISTFELKYIFFSFYLYSSKYKMSILTLPA